MSTWTDYLKTLGAELNDQQTEISVENGESGCIAPLLHQRLLTITGPDTDKFLQGQLSCDLNQARTQGSLMASHCNVKGHMISLFRLIAIENGAHLRLHHELLETAQAALAKYIIFSKAEISRSEDMVGLGLLGSKAAELGRLATSEVPSEDNGVVINGNRLLIRVPGDRFELWLPEAEALELMPQLLEHAALTDSNSWLLSEVHAAIPDLRGSTSEAFIPQMTNLQALEGVSFTKGCYTGQEIVTRLQHRGQLKRPMYRLKATGTELPQAGDAIHSDAKENVGQVVFAARNGDAIELLAVVVKDQADNQTLHLASQSGPVAELLELPYELDPKMFEPKSRL